MMETGFASSAKKGGPRGRRRRAWRLLPRCRSGATVVEYGLVVPFFLAFLTGTFEFGRVMWTDHALSLATQEAARYYLANPMATTADIKAKAEAELMTVDPSAVTVTVNPETLNGVDFITVQASYPYQPVMPIIPLGNMTLTAVSRLAVMPGP